MNIHNVSFLKSASGKSSFPRDERPHVAVAGRSNVGKSSLINCLFRRKKLARVSNTPGATRLINFFDVDGAFLLADLPGYGYAKRAKAERAEWRRLVQSYLDEVAELIGMLVLVDVRRGLEEEEEVLLDSLLEHGYRAVVVVTKADKLPKNQRKLVEKQMKAGFTGSGVEVLLVSSKTGAGRDRLWEEIRGWLPDHAPA